MTCENPEHAALESELNDALEEALQMEERLAAYEAAGADTGAARGVHAAKAMEEIAVLTEQVASLEKERDGYEQDYLNQKDRVNELETQLEDKDHKTKDLDRLRRKLEDDLENTRKLLQTEKTKAADAQKRAGGADRTRRTEQRDQIKVLQELQELRERTEDLEAQVKGRDALIEELVLSNQTQLERNETLTVQNEDLRGEYNEVSQLLEEKARELSDCHDQLEVAREAEEEYERHLDDEQTKNKRRIHALEEEIRAEKAVVAELNEEAARAKDQGGAGGARERELGLLRGEVERLGTELLAQSKTAEQASLDLEVLARELELERMKNRHLPHEIRSTEAHKSEALGRKVKELTTELESERERYRELEEGKARLETDLQESEDWKRRYEEGHGLVDAVRFQKRLKNDNRRLEAELERRSLKIGEVMDANEVLILTCQRLKEEAGKPEDFSYGDLAAFKEMQAGKMARLTALSEELQAQVDDLNDERVRLLKKLRDGAASGALFTISATGSGGGVGEGEDEGKAGARSRQREQELTEAVKRLTLDIHLKDAQIETLERSLVALNGDEAILAQIAGRPTPTGFALASSTAGDARKTVAGSAAGDASQGELATTGEVKVSRLEINRLARENRSLKEALWALAAASESDKHDQSGGSDRRGLEQPVATAGNGEDVENAYAYGDAARPSRSTVLETRKAERGREAAAAAAATAAEIQKVADERVAQLTRVNETIMRQLQKLTARRDSSFETARRAGRAGADDEGRLIEARGTEEDRGRETPAQTDMQRLVAEMGDIRQLVAGGFATNTTVRIQGTRRSSPPVSTERVGACSRDESVAGPGTVEGGKTEGVLLERQSSDQEVGGDRNTPASGTGRNSPFLRQKQRKDLRTPQTAQGQDMLRRHLRRLNLPPAEWADDVRDVTAQLVEALEQLRERELELDEHEELIVRYETHLSDMRTQAAALYRDHAEQEKQWGERQRRSKEEAEVLREERDALAVKTKRLEEVLDVEDKVADDPAAPHRALRELSRKVTVHEVNEAVMARRYSSVKEQLEMETKAREAAEQDFVEVSAVGKTRLLYLEQWKVGATARLLRLQQRLEKSVPEEDLICARRELEQLQEEFLGLLESSAESRVQDVSERIDACLEQVAKLSGLSRRVVQLEEDLAAAMTNLAASEEGLKQANLRAEKADSLAQVKQHDASFLGKETPTAEEAALREAGAQVGAAAGGATQANFTNLLAEVAKHQGEYARAEVERASAARRAELAETRLASLDGDCKELKERAASLETREREARQIARAAAAERIKVQNRFEGGLTCHQGRALKEKLEQESLRAEALELEAERCKEIADIASEQALAMNNYRKDMEDELAELKNNVSDLESRSDDDRLIGQLQRQLSATKATYRSFARKHELARANLRRKTALLKVLESRLDKREDALHDLHERSQEKVEALKGALIALSEGRSGAAPETGPDASAGPDHRLTITRGRELAARVAELSSALEASEAGLRVAEEARRSAEMDAESAEESRRSLETLVTDLKGLLLSPSDGRDLSASTSASGDDCVYARDTNNGDQGGGSGGERERVNHSSDAASRPALSTSFPFSLEPMKVNAGSNAAARSNAARRIVSLSEELRVSKLKASGFRRQVEGLKEDRRHSERKLEVAEAATRALEEAKAEAETRALLSEHVDGADGGGGDESRKRLGVDAGGNDIGDIGNNSSGRIDLDADGGSPGGGVYAGRRLGIDGLNVEEQRLLVAAAVPAEIDFGGLNPEEALRRLKGARAKAVSLTRALEEMKSERDGALVKAEDALRRTRDLQRELSFYEKQARQNGLPRLDESSVLPTGEAGDTEAAVEAAASYGGGSCGTLARGRRSMETEREREGMQEAASATVASLKRLLAEKNSALERMERKLEDARAAGRGSSVADRTEAARLTDRIYRDNEDSLGQLRVALRQLGAAGGLTGEGTAMNSRLVGQLEEVSGLLGEKDETIRQLELKLLTACNQRERAEQRCGQTLEENERMRSDLMTLASQVQDAEERALAALEDKAGEKRVAELRKNVLAKEKTMRALREALVKLKQEFVQAEVDREAAAFAEEKERAKKTVEERSQGVDERLKRLKEQLQTLQEGMMQAARDLERERRGREGATKAKEKVFEDNAKLRAEITKMEERVAGLEDRLTETRRDLDAAHEKEERLLSRIKTLSTTGGGRGRSGSRRGEGKSASDLDDDSTELLTGGKKEFDQGERRRLYELEKRVQVLTAQNAALRSIVPPPTPAKTKTTDKKGATMSTRTGMPGQGRRLGTAAEEAKTDGSGGKPADTTSSEPGAVGLSGGGLAGEGRREVAPRSSDAEKKLRRRVEALERRLEEKGVELQAAEAQTTRARDLLSRTTKDKEEALRKLKEAGRRREGGGSADDAEDMQSRLFSLEEENASLRRRAELEHPHVVESLKHQVRVVRAQLEEADDQLEDAERRAEAAVAQALSGPAEGRGGGGSGGGEGILRVEEGLYHELQAAREELSAQKAACRDFEGQILERDAANMELRFDLEASVTEAARLRRRTSELQAAVRRHRGSGSGSGGGGGGGGGPNANDAASRPVGGRFKRERDLEGVVDALKRVVEKLRGENKRLKRAAGDGGARAEVEKSAREAKKRAATLKEEVDRLAAKAKEADGAVLKLAQKQDQINQLRRKLKGREEDIINFQKRAEDLAETKTLLLAELEAANRRLISDDQENRSKPQPVSASREIAAARAENATLKEQVQHQADTIDRLRQNKRNDDAYGSPRQQGGEVAMPVTGYGSTVELQEAVETAEAIAEEAQHEADQLRRRLAESERELRRMERRMAGGSKETGVPDPLSSSESGSAVASASAVATRLEEENMRLKEENEKLSTELQAFDLEFFEEIEDLKYKYSEAARKLRHYEQASSSR